MRTRRDILPWQIGLALAVLFFLVGGLLAECPPQAPAPPQAPPCCEEKTASPWRQNDRGNWCQWHEGRWWTKHAGQWWTAAHGGTFQPWPPVVHHRHLLTNEQVQHLLAPVPVMPLSFGGGFRGGASARGGNC